MSKWLKVGAFASLLIASGYFFGHVCEQLGRAYELISAPSFERFLSLALGLLLALGAMAIASGLVAALLRPWWVCFGAFALANLAILFAWGPRASSALLVIFCFVASLIYSLDVVRELNERLSFSVRPIAISQTILLTALVVVACGAFYLGYAAQIEKEGFTIPAYMRSTMKEMALKMVEERIREAHIEPQEREALMARFEKEFDEGIMGPMEERLEPFGRFVPVLLAVSLFALLLAITRLFSWVPVLLLGLIFPLLTAIGVTRVVTEMREVRRLTLD